MERPHPEGDLRSVRLLRHRLAGEAVEPALQPASQAEVVRMHGEDVPLPEYRVVEPGSKLDLPRPQGIGLSVVIGRRQDAQIVFFGDPVVVEPAEGAFPAVFRPDVRDHRRHVQPADGVGEFPVVLAAGMPQELPQAVIGDEGDPGEQAAARPRCCRLNARRRR